MFRQRFYTNLIISVGYTGGTRLEEVLCNVEFFKADKTHIAKVQSALGGRREYRGESFQEVLEQVTMDLQEEFDVKL